MTDHEQPAAGVALKPLYDRLGYLNDPEGLARMREALIAAPNWHDRAPINCNSLARLLDTIEALRAPTDAGGAVSEAAWCAAQALEGLDELERLSSPQPLQQGGEVTRASGEKANAIMNSFLPQWSKDHEGEAALGWFIDNLASLAADRDKAVGLLREILPLQGPKTRARIDAFLSSQVGGS